MECLKVRNKEVHESHWHTIGDPPHIYAQGQCPGYAEYDDRTNAERERDEAIHELTEAIRYTVEYLGMDKLPPIEGWSWYDALLKYAPEKAHEFKQQYDKHHSVVRIDKYTISVDGVHIRAGADMERRIRELSLEEKHRFLKVLGKR